MNRAVYVSDGVRIAECQKYKPEDELRACAEGTDELKQGQMIYVKMHKDEGATDCISLAFHQEEGYAEVRVVAVIPFEQWLLVTIDRSFQLL